MALKDTIKLTILMVLKNKYILGDKNYEINKKILLFFISLIIILLIGITIYGYQFYKETISKEPLERRYATKLFKCNCSNRR